MICPKCGYDNLTEQDTCFRCGVIFAKIKGQPPKGCLSHSGQSHRKGDRPLRSQSSENSLVIWGRGLLLVGMVIWSLKLIFVSIASNTAGESLLHLVNLQFHEAGHVLFRPFGQFIRTLGGSLGQLLIPLICVGVLLLKTRDPFGAAVCGWWFGENFLDLAPYINDARAGVLPLLGGNTGHSAPYGFHDWEYLLTETGLQRYDHLLARMAHGFGSLVMIASLLFAGWVLVRQFHGTRS